MTKERPKVLLVDDDVELLDSLKEYLERQGYAALTAGNGDAALQAAREGSPDLILLDLTLPKLSGHKVLRLLKADASLSQIPIVVITGRAAEEDRSLATSLGANAFLVKPIDPSTLLSQISAFLKPGIV
ncbi:MAG: response regulator [Candidatus Omnitrophica bacterium]|nr:response regulator [Candidatus Omnitrophota bacterium]